MRKLPVYFVVDVSYSMAGAPLKLLSRQLEKVLAELSEDPYALETTYINLIVFSGKVKKIVSNEEVYKVILPELHVGSGTNIGAALDFLYKDIHLNVEKTTLDKKGDWKPLIFFFTDGAATDDYSDSLQNWKRNISKSSTVIGVGIGDGADYSFLNSLTDTVVKLSSDDEKSFKEFFKWISMSIQANSRRIDNPTSFERIILDANNQNDEKVDDLKLDKRYVILKAQCAQKHKGYLIKFKEAQGADFYDFDSSCPIDLKEYDELSVEDIKQPAIDANLLSRAGSCPICSAPNSVVLCGNCKQLHCAPTSGEVTCPWCGTTGTLQSVNSLSLNRSRG